MRNFQNNTNFPSFFVRDMDEFLMLCKMLCKDVGKYVTDLQQELTEINSRDDYYSLEEYEVIKDENESLKKKVRELEDKIKVLKMIKKTAR